MRTYLALALLMVGTSVLPAQEGQLDLDELARSAEQWARENLDDDALRVLQNVDRDRVKRLLADLQKQFQAEYVVDLGALKQTAKAVVPLLEQYEETLPYAIWLKTRLDYLDVAERFRTTIPSPKIVPGEPLKPKPNPTPEKEREIWIEKMSQRPWPERAKPYVSRLKPIFAAQKVPSELVWIAEVESSFDPRARSPAGAAGLFQLTPDTAKRFGLRVRLFDQRLNAEKSAEAAAKYLRYLHGHFKDWHLAVAAYNAGEGTVQNILKKRKAHTFDAIATHLPAETQLYVPKVEATLLHREGVQLVNLPST
jgi:membrane-bound lytic murein transglycosylase D